MIIPLPTPVPRVSMIRISASFPAPQRNSPIAAALASFSSIAGIPSASANRARRGMSLNPGMLGIAMTTPESESIGPGEATPTPDNSDMEIPTC